LIFSLLFSCGADFPVPLSPPLPPKTPRRLVCSFSLMTFGDILPFVPDTILFQDTPVGSFYFSQWLFAPSNTTAVPPLKFGLSIFSSSARLLLVSPFLSPFFFQCAFAGDRALPLCSRLVFRTFVFHFCPPATHNLQPSTSTTVGSWLLAVPPRISERSVFPSSCCFFSFSPCGPSICGPPPGTNKCVIHNFRAVFPEPTSPVASAPPSSDFLTYSALARFFCPNDHPLHSPFPFCPPSLTSPLFSSQFSPL